jgi:hypothetical protein
MSQNDIILGVLAWVADVCPEIQGTYDYAPSGKEQGLPDCVAEITDTSLGYSSPLFPKAQIEQALLMVYTMQLSFMVDNGDPQAAARLLRDLSDRLLDAALDDGTLGGRVPFVSPSISFDFSTPYVEYEDGTFGREMTMSLSVGGLVQEEQ